MKGINRLFFLSIFAIISHISICQEANRYVKDQVLISSSYPEIEIKIDDQYSYLGKLNFELFESAKVERFLFGIVENDTIQKMISFQFEEYLPNNSYKYVRSYQDSLKLGDYWFGFLQGNVGITHIGNFIKKWQGRGLEHEVTYEFLKEKGYKHKDEIVSLPLTFYSEDLRHELVIVNYENLDLYDLSLYDLHFADNLVRFDVPLSTYRFYGARFNKLKNIANNLISNIEIRK